MSSDPKHKGVGCRSVSVLKIIFAMLLAWMGERWVGSVSSPRLSQKEWDARKRFFSAVEAKERALAEDICDGQQECPLAKALALVVVLCDMTESISVLAISILIREMLWPEKPATSEGLTKGANEALNFKARMSAGETSDEVSEETL